MTRELVAQYCPRIEQRPFHSSRKAIRFIRGGVGAGKTLAGAAESLALAIENPGFDGMIVSPHWSTLRRVTLREFIKLVPRQLLVRDFKQERYIQLRNGSRVYYGSADKPETLEGSTLAWWWGDEARYWKAEAWHIMLARGRAPGAPFVSIVLTSTPSMGWLYEEFGTKENPDVGQWVVPTHTNTYLPSGYLDRLKRRYSPRLYKQYCGGEWVLLEGGVFEQFDRKKHVKNFDTTSEIPVEISYDFGFNRPSVQFNQDLQYCYKHNSPNCIHVLDEIVADRTPTKKMAILIDQKYQEHPEWIRGDCFCDPAGNATDQSVGFSSVDILQNPRDYGLSIPPIKCHYTYDPECRDIANGIEAIRAKLEDTNGKTSLYFHERMVGEGHERGIIKAMETSIYPSKNGRIISDRPVKDHFIEDARDTLRYYVVNKYPPVSGRITTV